GDADSTHGASAAATLRSRPAADAARPMLLGSPTLSSPLAPRVFSRARGSGRSEFGNRRQQPLQLISRELEIRVALVGDGREPSRAIRPKQAQILGQSGVN